MCSLTSFFFCLIKIINFNWFLFIHTFHFEFPHIMKVFCQRLLIFSCPCKFLNVEIAFKVEASPFGRTVNLRETIEYHTVICFYSETSYFSRLCNFLFFYFQYFWLQYIFTIEVKKVFLFANVLVKSMWHALFP